eukprot:531975_1
MAQYTVFQQYLIDAQLFHLSEQLEERDVNDTETLLSLNESNRIVDICDELSITNADKEKLKALVERMQCEHEEKPNPSGAKRFRFVRELAVTLQGRIYLVTDVITKEKCVVKEAWKKLVHSGRSRTNCRVAEDFLAERTMLLSLSSAGAIDSLVRAISCWDDSKSYFYAMEVCDGELFDFVNLTHKGGEYKIWTDKEAQKPQMPMTNAYAPQWIGTTQRMFSQIVSGVHWMHSHGYCHLDLSLENTMLSNTNKHKIKIIDFGLTKKFKIEDKKWIHQGRVGKVNYMPPEAYARQSYDARSADVYSLGIMLFMMLVGAPIYQIPHSHNAAFNYMIHGKLVAILKHWKRLRIVTVDALDLLNRILVYEPKRITLDQIQQHPFLTNTIKIEQEQKDAVEEEAEEEEEEDQGSVHGLDSGTDTDNEEEDETKRLLSEWGLAHCYPKLKETGWGQATQWNQLTASVLVYEIGFEKPESRQFLDCYLKFTNNT